MATINLLPWREEQRELRNKTFQLFLIGVVVAALAGVYAISQFYMDSTSAQNTRNNYLQKEIRVLDEQIAEIQELRNTRSELIERMELIQALQGNRPVIVRIFDEIARSVPEDLYFTEISVKGTEVKVKGVASSNNRVSALMRNFDQSLWFQDPALLKVEAKGQGVNEFEMIMKRVEPKNEEQGRG